MRFEDVLFVEVHHVEAAHSVAIEEAGGSPGIRDRGLLDSAVMAIRAGYHGSLAELAAVLCYGIAKNHPFLDGNKRAAFETTVAFLEVNGYALALEREKWRAIVEGVAAGTVTRDELVEHFALEMGGDEPFDE